MRGTKRIEIKNIVTKVHNKDRLEALASVRGKLCCPMIVAITMSLGHTST
jgi:hypothetical protein